MSCKDCLLVNYNKDGIMDKFCMLCDSHTMALNLSDLKYLAKKTKLKSVKKEYKKFKQLVKTITLRVRSEILCDK